MLLLNELRLVCLQSSCTARIDVIKLQAVVAHAERAFAETSDDFEKAQLTSYRRPLFDPTLTVADTSRQVPIQSRVIRPA
jgi:hypothetical protein